MQALCALVSAVTSCLCSKLCPFLPDGGEENILQTPTVSTALRPTFSVNNSATLPFVMSTYLWRFYLDATCSGNWNPLWLQLTLNPAVTVSIFIVSGFISILAIQGLCLWNSLIFNTYSRQLEHSKCSSRSFPTNIFTITNILSFS